MTMNENDKQAAQGKDILSPPHPRHFGIPAEHWERAKNYAEYLAQNKQAEPVEFNGWYCAQCQRGVAPSEVTFHETHTECGRYITDDEPPAQPVQPAGCEINNFSSRMCERGTHGCVVEHEAPAASINEQAVWDSALELSALTIQLFDEATLTRDDYMLDASECAGIILALKSMRSVDVEAEKAKGGV